MRCENAGADYDDHNIQWTCKAEIPDDFKLGSTDVRCEGYTGPKDPFVLKGSCGVEYRMVLTAKGEERYRHSRSWSSVGSDGTTAFNSLLRSLFWLLFIGVVLWIAIGLLRGLADNRRNGPQPPRVPRRGGGGGGWWGGGDDNDAPPPYSPRPPRKQPFNNPAAGYARGWQPGFWSGVMGGAAGGYFAGQRRNQNDRRERDGYVRGPARNWGYQNDDGGQGSSSYSTTTHTSTGFGSTSNR
jgi:SOCE-associated regulatory factor of calcium homoeostasis